MAASLHPLAHPRPRWALPLVSLKEPSPQPVSAFFLPNHCKKPRQLRHHGRFRRHPGQAAPRAAQIRDLEKMPAMFGVSGCLVEVPDLAFGSSGTTKGGGSPGTTAAALLWVEQRPERPCPS